MPLTVVAPNGERLTVERSKAHPTDYLFVLRGGSRFFLGVKVPGMTVGDVRRMAVDWLERTSAGTSA